MKAVVIGGGFAGMAAACCLAGNGHEVVLAERHETLGGRARVLCEQGFVFDMGPSWYWMPDVFDKFFESFGFKVSDFYRLVQPDPAFQVFFEGSVLRVPRDSAGLEELFESIEPGSGISLRKFLREAKTKYDLSMSELIYSPGESWKEYMSLPLLLALGRNTVFSSLRSHVRKHFKDPRLIMLMEFPVLFLGAMPDQLPALYSLMNHAAFGLGTWYPMGGMNKVVSALEELAATLKVNIKTGCSVKNIEVSNRAVSGVNTSRGHISADAVIATADYHHVEQQLLPEQHRTFDAGYWNKKVMAPTCLIFYLGVSKRIKGLSHHNLFFDADFEKHAASITSGKAMPQQPLFYVSCPSITDPSVAPIGCENLFILVPLAAGCVYSEETSSLLFARIMKRIEEKCCESITPFITLKREFTPSDFESQYSAFKGNAYGMANTLRQTAVLKPGVRSSKVKNLFYAGHLTVPGPGVPSALISGQIAGKMAMRSSSRKVA